LVHAIRVVCISRALVGYKSIIYTTAAASICLYTIYICHIYIYILIVDRYTLSAETAAAAASEKSAQRIFINLCIRIPTPQRTFDGLL